MARRSSGRRSASHVFFGVSDTKPPSPAKRTSTEPQRQRHSLRSRKASSPELQSAADSKEYLESQSGATQVSDSEPNVSDSEESNAGSDGEPESDDSEIVEPVQQKEVKRSRRGNAKNKDDRSSYYFTRQAKSEDWDRQQAVRRFQYLLGLSDLFRHFVDLKASKDPAFRSILDDAEALNRPTPSRRRSRRSVEEEQLMEEPEEAQKITVFDESPGFIKGTMRKYQIDGLNWLISLYVNSISGILADEMGLGKTYQCISFLAYLRHIQDIRGPHLVIVPKSTIQNWAREFAKWSPDIETLVLSGDKNERAELVQSRLLTAQFDVCITSFELVIREKAALQRIAWQYVVVDEAHRIKNEESILSRVMRVLHSRHRLLITGTPLQNNLHELWALLNFLLPDVFSDARLFDDWFQGGSDNDQQEDVIKQLHKLLRPFILRRVKADVEHSLLPKKETNLYIGMTDMQLQWYQRLLTKDLDAVNGSDGASSEAKMRLLNVVMQLRKCCNHPYLFEGAEPGPPFTTDEHLVQNSAKMLVLDKLLSWLKSQGSRVLIFSQMGRMLDILEDYCSLRNYEYCRIDGSTAHEDRVAAIDEYNCPESSKFLFLLTTRAGGLGINLVTADAVVLYDSDWNPQADLQAMDRAHRIGQTKQVKVFRLVTENAVEEKVLERAAHKLRLDQVVIQQGRTPGSDKASKEELASMIRFGAQKMLDNEHNTVNDASIEEIIRQGETRTAKLNEKYAELGFDDLHKFTFDAPAPIVNHHAPAPSEADGHGHRRARHAAISFDFGVGDDSREGTPVSGGVGKGPRPPRQLALHDFQFFDPRLADLQERELSWYRKRAGVRLAFEDFSSESESEIESQNAAIEAAQPLSEEEIELKKKLVEEGFLNFSKRDFHHFLTLLTRLGRHNVEGVVDAWPEKDSDEIRRYHRVFFERYTELEGHERYMQQLKAGETKVAQQTHEWSLLRQKVESTRAPQSELQLNYQALTKRQYTEEEDRFLVTQMYDLGVDVPNMNEQIRDRIRTSGLFDFDFFMLSRTPLEISRRCHTLRTCIAREVDGPLPRKRRARTREIDSKRPKQTTMDV